ncbi:hypothetical protein WICPIJ_009567 [Wickerhamomyces pijperi]|uniref:Uncharacterized protein n=1 Tax=Wickerhamomyces pijperi TaxID=599730 RepID=A0A9P8PLJ1_WICPI|nr:hypothetical protein WICPIJ_009567 [Wickerhamomyces pijperi]
MSQLNRIFSEHMSWMFFHNISDFDRIALFRKVPELELKYYSFKTTRVVLILHKKSQPIPRDFSLRYGNCNRIFVTVPDEFQYNSKENLNVCNEKHIEQTKANLQEAIPVLKDLVAKDMEFNGHLLVEFAFDMEDDTSAISYTQT